MAERILSDAIFWQLMLLLAALACLWLGWRRWKLARLIEDTPTSRVRSAAQGYVEVQGLAQMPAGSSNPAPLSRRPCVWWSFRIEQRRRSGKEVRWDTLQRGTSEATFLLSDETGKCLIDPQGAQVFPGDQAIWYGSTPWPANVGSLGAVVDRLLCEYRYVENRIYERSVVQAMGEFRTLGGLDAEAEAADAAELLRRWKADQRGLLARFDANHDGVLSQEEWEQARREARAQIQRQAAEAPSAALNILVAPAGGEPFLLAAQDLHRIASRQRLQAGALTVLGLMAVTALAMISLR